MTSVRAFLQITRTSKSGDVQQLTFGRSVDTKKGEASVFGSSTSVQNDNTNSTGTFSRAEIDSHFQSLNDLDAQWKYAFNCVQECLDSFKDDNKSSDKAHGHHGHEKAHGHHGHHHHGVHGHHHEPKGPKGPKENDKVQGSVSNDTSANNKTEPQNSLQGVIKGTSSLVGGVAKGVGSVVEGFKNGNVLGGIAKGVGNVVTGVAESVKDVATGVVNGVKNAVSKVGSFFKGLFGG